jgi:hypothetical protein
VLPSPRAACCAIALALALAACARTSGELSDSTRSLADSSALVRGESPANVPDAVPTGTPAASGEELPPDDCPVDSSARHESPGDLVREFVRRDAEGPMERPELAAGWESSAVTCVERLSSDHYEVIGRYSVETLNEASAVARYVVRRTRLFRLGFDEAGTLTHLVADSAEWADTVVAVRTSLGWRLNRFSAGAHRLPGWALTELTTLPPEERARLERLARQLQAGGA